MKNSKKLFLFFVVIFIIAMIYISYDISSKTTFPGSKPQLKERLFNDKDSKSDTLNRDSASVQM